MPPPLPVDALSANARIVDASYLESVLWTSSSKSSSKTTKKSGSSSSNSNKETVRRLAKIVHVLQTDESIDPARTDEWPGLSSLADLLVDDCNNNTTTTCTANNNNKLLLASPHKEVRLYTVLTCLELLGIFAPDIPGHWTTHQLLAIFDQTLQQVSNLSHCYTPTDRHFCQYTRILDLLAEVKIGIILVELVVHESTSTIMAPTNMAMNKNKPRRHGNHDDIEDSDNDDDDDDDEMKLSKISDNNNNNNAFSSSPSEVLAEFFQTLLGCVRREHPGQIRDQVVNALAACLEEFDCSARLDTSMDTSFDHHHSRRSSSSGTTTTSINIPIRIIDEILLCLGAGPTVTVNIMTAVPAPAPEPPTTTTASNKKKRKTSKQAAAAAPKAQLRTKLEQNPQYLVAAALLQKTANKTATPIAALLNTLLNSGTTDMTTDMHMSDVARLSSIVSDPEMAFCESHDDVWSIISQVHRVAPAVLTTVIGTVGHGLGSPEIHRRLASVQLLGQLFARKQSSMVVVEYRSIFTQWLGRQSDISVQVRKNMVSALLPILTEISSGNTNSRNSNFGDKNTLQKAVQCLHQLVCTDPDAQVRLQGIQEICEYAHKKGSVTSSTSTTSVWLAPLLKSVGSRLSAKHKQERKDAVTGLTRVYWKQYMMEHVLREVSVIKTAATANPSSQDNDDDDDDEDDDIKIVSPESLDIILRVLNEKCHLHKQRARRPRQSSMLLLPTTTPASKKKRQRRRGLVSDDDDDDDDVDAAGPDIFDEDDSEAALYAWIPKSVFSAVSYSDQMDTEMRSRIVQLVDEVLLGSDQFQHKTLTPLARAVGLTVILHSLREDDEENLLLATITAAAPSSATLTGSNNTSIRSAPFLWMVRLMQQRAALQKLLTDYMEARAKVREHKQGTEEALAADAKAMEILEGVAQLTAPVVGPGVSQSQVLQTIHEARDKHIFRILATIAQANHSHSARARALEELPKRTSPLGEAASTWVKNLVRRCAMGYFMNAEIVHFSVLLARESYLENDISACAALLVSAKTATSIFPALGGSEKTFQALTDLFSDCRAAADPKIKKEIKDAGIVTALSSILSLVAPLPSANPRGVTIHHDDSLANDKFRLQLFQLCTRDGTPEQARNAVYTLAHTASSSSIESSGGSQRSHQDMLSDLLKALTCPTRLTLVPGGKDPAIIRLFSALSAYVDCQPQAAGTDRMKKATRFALETILMGRGDDDDDDDATSDVDDDSDEGKAGSRQKKGKASKHKHTSPNGSASLLEDEDLSIACRRLCAAINFLVSHVRASILYGRGNGPGNDPFGWIPKDHAKQVFELLTQMLRDKGLPPSSRDRRLCKSRQDRAAVRQCSAIHLFRLCDSRLGLENSLLSKKQWHQFSTSLLDDEKVVRIAVMEEFSHFLKGSGVYGGTAAGSPSLRFVAFLAFCTDGDHGHDRDPANGFAANVGKTLAEVHSAALDCVVKLREACDSAYTKCRLMGPQAEKRFESSFKMCLMPEYMVPFAFHLLCHRRETITAVTPAQLADEDESDSDDEEVHATDIESKNRIVRKRLKAFFEPLVSSLGDSADNISFLLSMTAHMRNFSPIDVESLPLDSSIGSGKDNEPIAANHRVKLLDGSINLLSEMAREVLISLVKKDVNLSTYPGGIQIPRLLFNPLQKLLKRKPATLPSKTRSKRQRAAAKNKGPEGMDIDVRTNRKSGETTPTPASKEAQSQKHRSSIKKRPNQEAAAKKTPGSSPTARVHFSPDLKLPTRNKATVLGEDVANNFGGMSPIDKYSPPAPRGPNRSFAASASVATLGTTPPSVLPTGTQSTAQTDLTDTESVDSARPCNQIDVQSEVKLSLSSELGPSMSDDEGQHDDGTTTPEMQSSSVSRSSRTKKRKPDPLDDKDDDKEDEPRRRPVPEQIKFKDKFRSNASRKEESGGATESHSASENQENSSTRIGASKKKATQGTKVGEAKTSGRRRLGPRRA